MSPMSENSDRTRLLIVVFTVVIGLGVASIPLVTSLFSEPTQTQSSPSAPAGAPNSSASGQPTSGANSTEGEGAPQNSFETANPVVCPEPQGGEGASEIKEGAELAEVRLPCLTDGGSTSETSLAEQWAGKPTVVNVWAWWCGPCREELPVLQQLKQNNPQWNVVGVHLDPQGQAGVDFLQELGVTGLPSYQDSQHVFDSTTKIPKVVPVTLVYNPDGTRADMFARTFDDPAEMQELVSESLGEQDSGAA